MAHKFKLLPYTLVTIASLCFMSGVYVLTGGGDKYEEHRISNIHNRKNA